MRVNYFLFFYHRSSSNGQSCLHTKFQNRNTFPSGRKAITLQEEERKKTYENIGHLRFLVKHLPKPTFVPILNYKGKEGRQREQWGVNGCQN